MGPKDILSVYSIQLSNVWQRTHNNNPTHSRDTLTAFLSTVQRDWDHACVVGWVKLSDFFELYAFAGYLRFPLVYRVVFSMGGGVYRAIFDASFSNSITKRSAKKGKEKKLNFWHQREGHFWFYHANTCTMDSTGKRVTKIRVYKNVLYRCC